MVEPLSGSADFFEVAFAKRNVGSGSDNHFFSNLLPEAEIKKALSEKYGVSEGNSFRLLLEVGGECAGALSVLPKGLLPDRGGGYSPLSLSELNEMVKNLPARPLILAKDGLRLSLAGAQNKLPLYVKDGSFYLPQGFKSSSHILKPSIPRYEHSAENEAFCMILAERVGN